MKNNKIILVPTDFSDVCFDAINYACEIADYLSYSVLLLHVIDRNTKAALKKENLPESAIDKRLEDNVKRFTKKFGIEMNSISKPGDIFTTIGQVAAEKNVNLIVLGVKGKVGLRQNIAGSFARKVITSSPVPVLSIQKGTKSGSAFKNIVFPVSTTAEVRQKVAWAVLLAKTFKSKVHIFQLYEAPEESKKKMNVILNQIIKEFDREKVSYTHAVAPKGKNFGDQVIEYSKKAGADLITIMSRSTSQNFIFNNYSEHIILNKHLIPVMCVNPFETWEEIWKF